METRQRIRIEQLQPGVFIQLEGGWLDHPFLFNKFKLKNWSQVEILEKTGLREVVWVPEKSDCMPRELEGGTKLQPQASPPGKGQTQPVVQKDDDPYLELLWRIKSAKVEQLRQKHDSLRQCTRHYERIITSVPNLMTQMMTGSPEAVAGVREAVVGMVDAFLGDTDAIVHLINIKEKEESIYHHSMNVSVLALMIGKKARLTPPEMLELGMGALFHDIGKNRIDKKYLKKKGPLSRAEIKLIQLHPQYGVEILTKSNIREGVLRIVMEHHELYNGQGYPAGLEGNKISKAARIVRIVDSYDNLCNNIEPDKSMTPYEALSHMYTRQQNQIDVDLFSTFIRSMGIYPPGTVVQLSNGEYGIVISINPENPLRPSLLLYEPNIPKEEALIYDMEDDTDIAIERSIRPEDLAEDVRQYLSPTKHLTYFMEKGMRKGL